MRQPESDALFATADATAAEAEQEAVALPWRSSASSRFVSTAAMQWTGQRLATAVEACFADLRRALASGGATAERSSYGPVAHLLDSVGKMLGPKVLCVAELADQGAGHPGFWALQREAEPARPAAPQPGP